MEYQQLTGTRYVELRTKKLVEDYIEESTKIFLKELGNLIENFDKKIVEIDSSYKFQFMVPTVKKAGAGKKLVNITAIATGSLGAASLIPQITSGLGIMLV